MEQRMNFNAVNILHVAIPNGAYCVHPIESTDIGVRKSSKINICALTAESKLKYCSTFEFNISNSHT